MYRTLSWKQQYVTQYMYYNIYLKRFFQYDVESAESEWKTF